jgi:hypothetical protein
MSAELDALGGGDTRVAKVEGYCRVFPAIEEFPGSILSLDYDRSIVTVRYYSYFINNTTTHFSPFLPRRFSLFLPNQHLLLSHSISTTPRREAKCEK